jgi:hypothetical protein
MRESRTCGSARGALSNERPLYVGSAQLGPRQPRQVSDIGSDAPGLAAGQGSLAATSVIQHRR